MSKQFFTLLLSLSAATAGFSQDVVTVEGNVKGDLQGYNKIYIYYTNDFPRDSAQINNDGTFSFSYPFRAGVQATLYLDYEIKAKRTSSPLSVITDEPGKVYLKDIDLTKGWSNATITGDQAAEDNQAFTREQNEQTEKINTYLKTQFPGKNFTDPAYRRAYDSLNKAKVVNGVKAFIPKHPDAYASAIILRNSRSSMGLEDMEPLYNLLSDRQKASFDGVAVANFITGLKSSAIGSTVQDFTLPTPEEKTLTFSNLKGKYILIDFWASWCGPCKASFPHLKEVYAKYKGDKFEVFSISVDKDKEAWLKELKKQELPWLQALDNIDLSHKVFAVYGIPTTYLIDPSGKIIMKEIGFDSSGNGAMEKKLNELFAKQ